MCMYQCSWAVALLSTSSKEYKVPRGQRRSASHCWSFFPRRKEGSNQPRNQTSNQPGKQGPLLEEHHDILLCPSDLLTSTTYWTEWVSWNQSRTALEPPRSIFLGLRAFFWERGDTVISIPRRNHVRLLQPSSSPASVSSSSVTVWKPFWSNQGKSDFLPKIPQAFVHPPQALTTEKIDLFFMSSLWKGQSHYDGERQHLNSRLFIWNWDTQERRGGRYRATRKKERKKKWVFWLKPKQ